MLESPLIGRVGQLIARSVGLAFVLYGLVVSVGNLAAPLSDAGVGATWWVVALVILVGLVAIAGGALFLLSIDGPDRYGRRWIRAVAVGLMILTALLPTIFSVYLLVLALLMVPSVWIGVRREDDSGASVTSG